MTYTDTACPLPDPERQADFYDGVTMKRAVAWIVDTILIGLATGILATVTIVGWFMLPLFYLAIGFLYRWVTVARGSATWGMRLMAIELRDAWGQRLNAGQAFLHVMGYTISMAFFPVQLVSMALMCIDPRGRGLTDMALGTVMLNQRA